jgi:glycosyltransferase involved in cell wall biosynthesis
MPDDLSVLYIDYSVGFGGATKSLALTLAVLPDVRKVMLTCQDLDIIDSWYRGVEVHSFRRFFNYRNTGRARSWVRGSPLPGWIYTGFSKLLAILDVLEALRNTAKILWLWRHNRFNVIHLNNGFIPLEGILAARILDLPLIVHLRGFLGPADVLGALTLQRVTQVIAVSNAVAENVHAAGVSREQITTIYDPVDVDLFDAAAGERPYVREGWGLAESDIAVGIFGRVIDWKGQREFVHAMLAALPHNPALKAVIIGDQSDGALEYYQVVRRLIDSSPYRDRFILPGYLEDVEASYHAIDIVVHASIEPEPFGMVVPEGMAARKAVIAAAAGGPVEVITNGQDGLLVPPGDIAALKNAILELAADPGRRRRLGENGYAKVRQGFTIAAAAGQLATVYGALGRGTPVVVPAVEIEEAI